MFTHSFLEILVCPDCQLRVKTKKGSFYCQSCKRLFPLISGIPVMLSGSSSDIEVTKRQWDKNYLEWMKEDSLKYLHEYKKNYLDDILRPINKFWKIKPGLIYCEIGCGPAIVGLKMAQKGCQVMGIDISLEGLKLARDLYDKEKAEGAFVLGNILKMPFKEESLDLIYGGGVLEHFKNTAEAIRELYRVLKKGGHILTTVPFLSLSALTYRQLYGNIPDLPLLKNILEFIHIKILKKRFMPFGYEKSFTQGKLRQLFFQAGFQKIKIDFFECHLPFYRFKNESLKEFLRKIAKFKPFWPMIYVEAVKR